MTNITTYRPTFLYIKRHKLTGMLYFGKTIRKDPTKYNGSGSYWTNHIKKHGKEHIETLWFELFETQEKIVEFAELFSELHNIANSDKWANQIGESGLDQCTGVKRPNWTYKHSEEMKEHLRQQKLGKKRAKFSDETRANMSAGHIGVSSGAKGKTWTWDKPHPNKGKERPKLPCPVCGRLVSITAINRYHSDNCKLSR